MKIRFYLSLASNSRLAWRISRPPHGSQSCESRGCRQWNQQENCTVYEHRCIKTVGIRIVHLRSATALLAHSALDGEGPSLCQGHKARPRVLEHIPLKIVQYHAAEDYHPQDRLLCVHPDTSSDTDVPVNLPVNLTTLVPSRLLDTVTI